jgi:hypothetical protein
MPSSWRTAGRSIRFFGISAFTQNSGTRIIGQQSHEFAALEARHDDMTRDPRDAMPVTAARSSR